jgi:hypothetical protein
MFSSVVQSRFGCERQMKRFVANKPLNHRDNFFENFDFLHILTPRIRVLQTLKPVKHCEAGYCFFKLKQKSGPKRPLPQGSAL